jgi:diamine N-acetyltransferase
MSNEPELEVTLQEITEDTLWSILDLEVTDEQRKYVASNATSIAEAHFSDFAWFRAIYAGGEPVGFVLLFIDEEEDEYDLWRMMIDKKHQGKGYGGRALRQVIEYVSSFPGAQELTLSYLPGDGNPGPFFTKFGFEDSDEWVDDEKLLALNLDN